MARKSVPFSSVPVVGFLLARQERGMGRYKKQRPRDPEERSILLDLALKRMEKADQNNFVPLGYRRRRVLPS